ncbi:hypothetical protein CEE44_01290 [Candidatus Woesearchaeota archaeon B3_Woes]|nr:MAG: hypothetical protein CEE44_01290 [Candidatus Woesearchaeota archaeon B3_Woes]
MNDQSIILVGGTGVGKSTLVEGLRESFDFYLVDRRSLVDKYVLPAYEQYLKDNGIEFKRDREHRFDSTAWYKNQGNPGLAKLVERELSINNGNLLLVDNLRGPLEIKYTIDNIPDSLFVALDAPDEVRIKRLLGRNSDYDGLKGNQRERYLEAKAVIEKESKNYNLAETFEMLRFLKSRAIYIDTKDKYPEECLRITLDFVLHRLGVNDETR